MIINDFYNANLFILIAYIKMFKYRCHTSTICIIQYILIIKYDNYDLNNDDE